MRTTDTDKNFTQTLLRRAEREDWASFPLKEVLANTH